MTSSLPATAGSAGRLKGWTGRAAGLLGRASDLYRSDQAGVADRSRRAQALADRLVSDGGAALDRLAGKRGREAPPQNCDLSEPAAAARLHIAADRRMGPNRG